MQYILGSAFQTHSMYCLCYIKIAWLLLLYNRLRTWHQYRMMQELQNRSGISYARQSANNKNNFSLVVDVVQESWFSISFIPCRFLLICQLRKLQSNIYLGKVFFLEKLWEHYLRTGWDQYPGCSEYEMAKSVFIKYFLEFELHGLRFSWNILC